MEKKATIHKKLLKDFNFFSEGYLMKKLYVEVKDVMTMEMFQMNNKSIIEFGYNTIRGIMQNNRELSTSDSGR